MFVSQRLRVQVEQKTKEVEQMTEEVEQKTKEVERKIKEVKDVQTRLDQSEKKNRKLEILQKNLRNEVKRTNDLAARNAEMSAELSRENEKLNGIVKDISNNNRELDGKILDLTSSLSSLQEQIAALCDSREQQSLVNERLNKTVKAQEAFIATQAEQHKQEYQRLEEVSREQSKSIKKNSDTANTNKENYDKLMREHRHLRANGVEAAWIGLLAGAIQLVRCGTVQGAVLYAIVYYVGANGGGLKWSKDVLRFCGLSKNVDEFDDWFVKKNDAFLLKLLNQLKDFKQGLKKRGQQAWAVLMDKVIEYFICLFPDAVKHPECYMYY